MIDSTVGLALAESACHVAGIARRSSPVAERSPLGPGRDAQPTGRLRATPPLRETSAMNDDSARIAALLHEAGETHHQVYRIVDGDDPDWASWYAQWLLDLSELPQIVGTTPVRSELVWML